MSTMFPRVEASGTSFYAVSGFQHKDKFKGAGWKWDPDNKRWWTNNPQQAKPLRDIFAPSAQELFAKIGAEVERKIAASHAKDANVVIPVPEGLAYLPYQRAGIAFAIGRPNTLIADSMGLGKTIQALGVINADPTIQKTLVVCPASLKINWKREAEKWLVRPAKISVVTDGKNWADADANIVIVNYDLLKKHHEAIHGIRWDLLLCDESHTLKNGKAARTAEVVGGRESQGIVARRKIFMTGTPILNRPAELWTTLKYLGVESNWVSFHTRHCGAYQNRYGWDVSGATNLPELEEKLRSTVMIRRQKEDVLTELPPKQRNVIPLEIPNKRVAAQIAKQVAVFDEAEAARAKAEALQAKVGSVDAKERENTVEWKEAQRLLASREAAFTEISLIRHQLGLEKVPIAMEMIAGEMESIPQVVVFAHHKDVVDGLARGLREQGHTVVTLTGQTAPEDRQKAVDDFQAGKAAVFIGTIDAAGVGLTLTKSSRVIFVESSWVPGKLEQAEDRCHRIGQIDSVSVSHLVFDESLDARMLHTVITKMNVAEQALDGNRVKAAQSAEIVPDFSGELKASVAVNEVEQPLGRWEQRTKLAENLPDGFYSLPGIDGAEDARYSIQRSEYEGKNYLFVGVVDENGKISRIHDQAEQDTLLARIAEKPNRLTEFEAAVNMTKEQAEAWKAGMIEAGRNVPTGYYALEGHGQKNETNFFRVTRTESGGEIQNITVQRYIGGSGPVPLFPLEQRSALHDISKEPKAAAERFASKLGCCYSCNRDLTDDLSRKLGIGPVCREGHEWYGPQSETRVVAEQVQEQALRPVVQASSYRTNRFQDQGGLSL